MQLLSACRERKSVLMLYLIWFHWMRRCDRACVGAAGKLQGRGRRRVVAAGKLRRVLQRGCRGEGVLWCVQCAQWTVMLTLKLGGDLDVATWV